MRAVCMCAIISAYVCMYACMYVYVCMYVNTHTHGQTYKNVYQIRILFPSAIENKSSVNVSL